MERVSVPSSEALNVQPTGGSGETVQPERSSGSVTEAPFASVQRLPASAPGPAASGNVTRPVAGTRTRPAVVTKGSARPASATARRSASMRTSAATVAADGMRAAPSKSRQPAPETVPAKAA